MHLPIHDYAPQLRDAITTHKTLLIIGQTGSGKTTCVPRYALETITHLKQHKGQSDNKIYVTQPRRIAAIALANRVAFETKTKIGELVGYKVRFDEAIRPQTKIIYMTDGILLRMWNKLKNGDIVILDEAHERSLDTDILFGLLKQRIAMHDIKVIIMSATIDTDKLSDYFDGCPTFLIPGRNFKVDIVFTPNIFLAQLKHTYLQAAIAKVQEIHDTEAPGDILVFLTGRHEIETAVLELEAIKGLLPIPVYSALERDDQRRIFDPPPKGIRKVVLATNIAATSITIDGIVYVVDAGFVKQSNYNASHGMDSLLVVPISKSAAEQRAGRAGRTKEGKAFRCYSEADFDAMIADDIPEIQRSALTSTILTLKELGIRDVKHFDFLDPPTAASIDIALLRLYSLGALDKFGCITKDGRFMSAVSISPYQARSLLCASENGCISEVCDIVAMLATEDVYVHKHNSSEALQQHAKFDSKISDHLTLLNIYKDWISQRDAKRWAYQHYLHYRALSHAKNIREQIQDQLATHKLPLRAVNEQLSREDAILKSLVGGYFLNSAMRTPRGRFFHHYPSTCSSDVLRRMSSSESQVGLQIYSRSSILPRNMSPQDLRFWLTDSSGIEWVIYNETTITNGAWMKNVSAIKKEWVVEACAQVEAKGDVVAERLTCTENEEDRWKALDAKKERQKEKTLELEAKEHVAESIPEVDKKAARVEMAQAARERYLSRKKRKMQAT